MLYHEVQRFRQPFVVIAVAFVTLLMWWAFVQQIVFGVAFGNDPMPDALLIIMWLAFGIGFPLFFYRGGLVTHVREDGLSVKLGPFGGTHIAFDEIVRAEVRQYKPLREYGGWGIRYGFGRGWAYNASGNEGVQLTLRSGKRVLIGSQRPQELLAAIQEKSNA